MKSSSFFRLTACCSLICLMTIAARGEIIFTNLVLFSGVGGVFPGAVPHGGLALGADGNFYGTTSQGGSNNLGTVFRLTPGGDFTSIFSFNGTNGANPNAVLTLAKNGILYGTTYAGGVSNWGTVFLITTNGSFTNLFSFTGTNGANPGAALVADGTGNFFGTAEYGGAHTNAVAALGGNGYGTLFEMTGDGAVTVPIFFDNTNGAYPSGGLVLGNDGSFYGTTAVGGQNSTGIFPGYGTVFKMTPDGMFTNLYQFTGGDGGFIYAGLAQGHDGDLYGAAFNGGSQGYGTLFKISTNGDFVPLHTFSYFERGSPFAGMMEGSDGNFYGTTYGFYFSGSGTVFQLKPDGTFTNLVFFNGASGSYPAGVWCKAPTTISTARLQPAAGTAWERFSGLASPCPRSSRP